MKYKYKLTIKENEETGGPGSLTRKNELTLTVKGDYKADDILKMLKDPKNFGKTFVKKSGDKKELETKVFGLPNIPANKKKNAELMASQGERPFYKEVEEKTGKTFAAIQSNGFPARTKSNGEIIDSYLTSSDELVLSPNKIDDNTIKFPLKDELDIKKVLGNAGLTAKDYTLKKTEKLDESQLRKVIKEQINKLFKKK
jgi:hypothetical protein